MIDNNYHDTKTPEMVERLQAFWKAQDILGTTWAPSFGQYPADLIFEADQDAQPPINPSLASQEPSQHQIRYDDHIYQAQGEEPPTDTDTDEEAYRFYRGVLNLVGYMVAGGIFVWAVWCYGLPMFINGLLWLVGQ